MNLEQALKLKDKLFPKVESIYSGTVVRDVMQYVWAIKFLYGNGYEVIKKEKK